MNLVLALSLMMPPASIAADDHIAGVWCTERLNFGQPKWVVSSYWQDSVGLVLLAVNSPDNPGASHDFSVSISQVCVRRGDKLAAVWDATVHYSWWGAWLSDDHRDVRWHWTTRHFSLRKFGFGPPICGPARE
jgi:hypothetical protein